MRVRGSGRGYASAAGVVCFRPGHRPHFFYRLHLWHGRKGERKSFTWTEYRDLIVVVHRQLGTPVVWVWDNLPVHLTGELTEFIAKNKEWLTVVHLPAYAPDLNPVEGVWSLVKRSLENFAAASMDHLVRVLKRKLKKVQYRPHVLQGCLAGTGLIIDTS